MASDADARAQARLRSTIEREAGVADRLLAHCAANVPRDRYVHPSRMRFIVDRNRKVGIVYGMGSGVTDPWSRVERMSIHPHALGQMCDTAGLPRLWRNRTDVLSVSKVTDAPDWRRAMLVRDLNDLYAHEEYKNKLGKPAKFLHRLVGNEVRGFLTQSYNRHLVSLAVLRPFVAVCDEVGLEAVSAEITDIRVGLQTYLPYVYSPYPGEFVAVGAWWGNSDFGQGRVKVGMTLLRLNSSTSLLAQEEFGMRHIGSVVEAADMEEVADSVHVKELDTVAEAIQTTVRELSSQASIDRLLSAVAQANEECVPWSKIRGNLVKLLSKSETESVESLLDDGIVDLPPPGMNSKGEHLPSKWWMSNALSHLAEKTMDQGRAKDLRLLAGKMLS